MPLEHVNTDQAFREITNFIRENGDDWDKFCNNVTCPSTMKKAIKPPPSSRRKVSCEKTAKTTGDLAAEPLLQVNPHRFVLFPIQHNGIWRLVTSKCCEHIKVNTLSTISCYGLGGLIFGCR